MINVNIKDLDRSYTYIAKAESGFIEGTKCILEDNWEWAGGIWRGKMKLTHGIHDEHHIHKYGDGTEIELSERSDFDIFTIDGESVHIIE